MRLNSWLELTPADGYDFALLKSHLEVPNPEYTSAVRMHLNTQGMHRFDPLYEEAHDPDGTKVLRVPRGLVNQYGTGREVIDQRVEGYPADLRLKIELGPTGDRLEDQKDFVAAVADAARRRTGAIGQAAPGYGKTICALGIAAALGRTTAVLVHKSFLMNQWIERIQDAYDIDPNDIGQVQQDVCDFRGKKIVLIMVQSLLSSRVYPADLFTYFGTVMTDEVHRFGAVEFRRAITMFPAMYRVGFTATPKRPDGLETVFFMHLGDIAFVGTKSKLAAKVKYVNSEMVITPKAERAMLNYRKEFDLVKVTSHLVQCETRNRQIIKLAIDAMKHGRKILLLSGRREHLKELSDILDTEMQRKTLRFTHGYYVGGMTEQELHVSATRQMLFATFQMAQEGLDIPDLDTLFLVTPKGDIVQAVGRILRAHPDKRPPIVLDIVDNQIGMCANLAKKRAKQYREMGCTFLT